MTSRIFSINLDDLTFAKLGELQKKYPDKSRNAMIRHIIHVVHSGEVEDHEDYKKHLVKTIDQQVQIRLKLESELKRYQAVFGFIGGEQYEWILLDEYIVIKYWQIYFVIVG